MWNKFETEMYPFALSFLLLIKTMKARKSNMHTSACEYVCKRGIIQNNFTEMVIVHLVIVYPHLSELYFQLTSQF